MMKKYWKLFGEWVTDLIANPSRKARLLKEVSQAQKRFMADASHELRTPLSIIKTTSEVALFSGDNLKTQDAITALKSNIEEVDRMSKIIENLGTFSYYDLSTSVIEYKPINLSQLIEYLIEKISILAKKKSIKINLFMDSVIILANKAALEEMAINLLKNSIYYTPVGGSISIKILHLRNRALLSIQDNGIGIDHHDLPHIFEPFYKSAKVKSHNKIGSGLGLAIVKKIIDRHKGSIKIDSWPGEGTLVSISLPTLT